MSLGKMSSLTITDIKFLCKCYLPLNLYSRTFQACIKEEEEKKKQPEFRHSICTHLLVNTFIMLDWGALKQLHSTFMNTGSCLVSAFMQCSCFYVICDITVEWMCLFNRQ